MVLVGAAAAALGASRSLLHRAARVRFHSSKACSFKCSSVALAVHRTGTRTITLQRGRSSQFEPGRATWARSVSTGGSSDGDDDGDDDDADRRPALPRVDSEAVEDDPPSPGGGDDGDVTPRTESGWPELPSEERTRVIIQDISDQTENLPAAGGASSSNGGGEEGKEVTVSKVPFVPELIALPVSRRPLFPGVLHPITLSDKIVPRALKMLQQSGHSYVGVFFRKDSSAHQDQEEDAEQPDETQVDADGGSSPRNPGGVSGSVPTSEELALISELGEVHSMGVMASVERMESSKEGGVQLLVRAHRRVKIKEAVQDEPILKVSVEHFDNDYLEFDRGADEVKAYTNEIMLTMRDMLKLNPLYKDNLLMMWSNEIPLDVARLCDFMCGLSSAEGSELQLLLEELNMYERLSGTLLMLKKELQMFELQRKLAKSVEEKISQNQRKYFLGEQLKLIKRELGIEKDDKAALIAKYTERLEGKTVPPEAQTVIDEELAKLTTLESASSEFNVTRNYLDHLTELPWGMFQEETLDPVAAQAVLDEDHYGLEDVKERICEFIAVGALRGQTNGKIICMVGPPGVGKTSIGKSIAKSLGREFFRFSVGGLTDTAEIKGHRRTYVGAMPGKMLQSLKTTASMNPVVLIDEIDKMGASHTGDPASALLELLDPEQNSSFVDHYLDVPVDLSKVLFLCTANVLETIPGPLRDRMEVLRLSGYILSEKMAITKQYLHPQALIETGLNDDQVVVEDDAVEALIKGYCREAGVRNLQQHVEKLLRKIALKVVKEEADTPELITAERLPALLGKPPFNAQRLYETGEAPPGVVTGLAWTAMGGSTLFIESVRTPSWQRPTADVNEENGGGGGGGGGGGSVRGTGQLGDVMKESLSIAHNFARRYLHMIAPDVGMLATDEVHIHVPDGAVPKDGPSAGITMVTALLSLALDTPVLPGVAMTGELSLTGRVLPIGGVKEKTIAARRDGVEQIILPEANRPDWEELPDMVKADLHAHFVGRYEEVFSICFPDYSGGA